MSSGGSNDGEGGAAAVQPHAETASRIASIHRAHMAETVLQRSPSFITRRTRCRGVARHDRFGATRRAIAIALLGLIGLLPAVDTVACPDGCSNAVHATAGWQTTDACAIASACGLCVNAFFVRRDVIVARRCDCVVAMLVVAAPDLPATVLALIERPPRRV